MASISPPRKAFITGGVPLNGMIWTAMPAELANNSAARCWVVPICGVPRLSFPGLARA